MLSWAVSKLIGSRNERETKKLASRVKEILAIEEKLQEEKSSILEKKTKQWQKHLHRYLPLEIPTFYELKQLDDLLPIQELIQKRFDDLGKEFPSLPSQIGNSLEDIEKAYQQFSKIEPEFNKKRQEYLKKILPEAYAVVKNAARRLLETEIEICGQKNIWQMVHFDVQIIGGIALHQNTIAEMQTGEGKTLVSTFPSYLNALTGLGVHIVTVNDYLAKRDSEWMSPIYQLLGISVGCLQNQQTHTEKKKQYSCDITYGTSSEFGFDYLRDNGMASSKEEQVQRGHYFALVDEIDSILIDEARTPLIISGPSYQSSNQQYEKYTSSIVQLIQSQKKLCNKIYEEILEIKEQDENSEKIGLNLLKLKLGQPKSSQFLELMEDPLYRKLLEKAELSMHLDTKKKTFFSLKEELYFSIEEKTQETDLTEKGRIQLCQEDKNAFILPDLISHFSEIDANPEISNQEKAEQKEKLQQELDEKADKIHSISQLLRAHCLYEKDVDYLIKEGKVVIIDESTGREMPGRRWSDGLHQAIEAKEKVQVEEETQTFASITIQNYFRLYEKLAGMTGTAETESAEFFDIYKLKVLTIPTNKPCLRIDENDSIFKTEREKNKKVIERIKELHLKGQPVLVGTNSVNSSEKISKILKPLNIPHSVLNAKNHSKEAEIIARAGQRGVVTISTNMAGRGTDIKLGEGVAKIGGLAVLGTERYESRRTDRQLRGRCARQGDPGFSQFFISFEDDLMRNFASTERITKIMNQLGLKEGEVLEHKWLNRSIEMAQKRVEQRNYIWRKRILDFDDILNQQREILYDYRQETLHTQNTALLIEEIIETAIPLKIEEYIISNQGIDIDNLTHWLQSILPKEIAQEELENKEVEEINEFLISEFKEVYAIKISHEKPEIIDNLERQIILNAIDRLWQKHLYEMDSLREGIQLRAQGQKDPLIEYKQESFSLFSHLMTDIQKAVLENLFRSTTNLQGFEKFLSSISQELQQTSVLSESEEFSETLSPQNTEKPSRQIGRNEPCPCGSGKKYKKCCG